MRPVLEHDRAVILHGDSAKIADVLPEDSVDAIITDPPAGIGFMGKGWDSDKGGRDAWIAWLADIMRNALRVLKPGGHALVWAIPRTSHWTAMALEDAGFEVRDVVMHIFGTGFPKSLDVSKAIDAALGAERGVTGERRGTGNKSFGGDVENGKRFGATVTETAPGSEDAARWEGWGTALKPAAEHWILCRKPLDGTVAKNVLAHGTGGLNIDACRIGTERRINPPAGNKPGGSSFNMSVVGMPQDAEAREAVGRWPAHVTLDEHAAALLDQQSGTLKSGQHTPTEQRHAPGGNGVTHGSMPGVVGASYGDAGGASRFFYVAKAPRSEKDAGLDHLPKRSGGEATDREDGSAGLGNPRAGAGRTGGARNFHPTVKSLALMRWLVRLITPPGGTVLDLFAGSGSTLVAALEEGFNAIGVELTDEYLPILVGRVQHALGNAEAQARVA